MRQPKENTDPEATIKQKICTCCGVSKFLIEYPFNYYKKRKTVYRATCRACENIRHKKNYQKRKEQKSLTIAFDGHLPSNDGALINIENVEASNEK